MQSSRSKVDLHSVLKSIHLSCHEKTFLAHGIKSLDDMILLSPEDMSELGVVKIGERNRLRAWIEKHQVEISKSVPYPCEDDEVVSKRKLRKIKKRGVEKGKSFHNIVTQARSFAGSRQRSKKSPLVINVSMNFDDSKSTHPSDLKKNLRLRNDEVSRRRNNSLTAGDESKVNRQLHAVHSQREIRSISKEDNASRLVSQNDNKKDLFLPSNRSSSIQSSDGSVIAESKKLLRRQQSISDQHQNIFLNKKTLSFIPHEKDQKKISVSLTRFNRGQTSEAGSTGRALCKEQQLNSGQSPNRSISFPHGAPLSIYQKEDEKDSSWPSTKTSRGRADEGFEKKTGSYKKATLLIPQEKKKASSVGSTRSISSRTSQGSGQFVSVIKDTSAPGHDHHKDQENNYPFIYPGENRSTEDKAVGKMDREGRSLSFSPLSHRERILVLKKQRSTARKFQRSPIARQNNIPMTIHQNYTQTSQSSENTEREQSNEVCKRDLCIKSTCSPCQQNSQNNYVGAAQCSTIRQNQNTLGKQSIPPMLSQEEISNVVSSSMIQPRCSLATSTDDNSEKYRRAQCSSKCKHQNNLEHENELTSISLLHDHRDLFSSSCPITDLDFTEDGVSSVEKYMVESDFMHMPNISDCGDRYCRAIFNFLIIDKNLVRLFSEKFCSKWLLEVNRDGLAIKDIDKNSVVDIAIHNYTKLAHRYSHTNALELCKLPHKEATIRVRGFRKAALEWACKTSVDYAQISREGALSMQTHISVKSIKLSSPDVDSDSKKGEVPSNEKVESEPSGRTIPPQQIARQEDGGNKATSFEKKEVSIAKVVSFAPECITSPHHVAMADSAGILDDAEHNSTSSYENLKTSWEKILEKEQNVISPLPQPLYKPNDPRIHSELSPLLQKKLSRRFDQEQGPPPVLARSA